MSDRLDTLDREAGTLLRRRAERLDRPDDEALARIRRRAARPRGLVTAGAVLLLVVAVVGVAWLVRIDGLAPVDADHEGTTVLDAGADSGWEAVGGDAFHTPDGSVRVTDVAVAGEAVVAVGRDSRNGPEGMAAAGVSRSDDGREWRRVAADRIDDGGGRFAGAASAMEGVAVVEHGGGSRLVAVGWAQDEDARVPIAWISDDRGASWRLVEPEGVAERLESVAASPAGLVAVGGVELTRGMFGASWVSADGERWERQAVSGSNDTDLLHSVAAAGGELVAAATVPGDEPVLWTSRDGLAWQPARVPEDADGRVRIARVAAVEDGGFLAVGSVLPPGQADGDGLVLRSADDERTRVEPGR